jgi:hypothetical protein
MQTLCGTNKANIVFSHKACVREQITIRLVLFQDEYTHILLEHAMKVAKIAVLMVRMNDSSNYNETQIKYVKNT